MTDNLKQEAEEHSQFYLDVCLYGNNTVHDDKTAALIVEQAEEIERLRCALQTIESDGMPYCKRDKVTYAYQIAHKALQPTKTEDRSCK